MAVIINASTSTGLVQSADTSGIIQFQSNGSTKATLNSSGFSYPGGVLQVVQTAYTTVDSTSSTIPTMANTGCTATITPSSSSNKILAMLSMATYHPSAAQQMAARIMRGSSAAFSGITGDFYHPSGGGVQGNINIQWLDSPATTSPVTYTAQFSSGSGTVQINKDYFGNNNGVTYLTLLEIAA